MIILLELKPQLAWNSDVQSIESGFVSLLSMCCFHKTVPRDVAFIYTSFTEPFEPLDGTILPYSDVRLEVHGWNLVISAIYKWGTDLPYPK